MILLLRLCWLFATSVVNPIKRLADDKSQYTGQHCLSIPSGTLTREERYKINEHVISSLRMLEHLPFPEEMTQIPRYATTHHEVLNGTGTPGN